MIFCTLRPAAVQTTKPVWIKPVLQLSVQQLLVHTTDRRSKIFTHNCGQMEHFYMTDCSINPTPNRSK